MSQSHLARQSVAPILAVLVGLISVDSSSAWAAPPSQPSPPKGPDAAAGEPPLSGHHRLVLDIRGDGFRFDGRNPKLNTRWTRAGGDDAFLAVDTEALQPLNITLLGKDLALLRGVIPFSGNIRVVKEGKSERAANAWAMLSLLDQNADGMLAANDAVWPALRVFVDLDGDGEMASHETSSLRDTNIRSIGPRISQKTEKDNVGNLLVDGPFTRTNESIGRVVDTEWAVADSDVRGAIARGSR